MNALLSPEQVAVALGVSRDIIEHLMNNGEMSFYAIGPEEEPRFSEAHVQAYLDSCERTLMPDDVEEATEQPDPVKPLKHLQVE